MIGKNKIKIIISLWGPVALWLTVIFSLSSIPTLPKAGFIWWDFIIKKSAHVIEYAILFFLLWRAAIKNHQPSAISHQPFILIFVFCILYAFSDEFHQSFVPGRTAHIRDVGFDALGMLASWWKIKQASSGRQKVLKKNLQLAT